MPKLAILLGIAGIIPFAACGVATLGLSQTASLLAEQGLAAYGAIILGFLGGVHWGFTLGEQGDARAQRARLTLGVAPALIGWAAILTGLITRPVFSLVVLIAGFIGTLVMETRAHKRDLMPAGYMTLRWIISLIVIAILIVVTSLRLVGAHILL